jgi:hypothetical protein
MHAWSVMARCSVLSKQLVFGERTTVVVDPSEERIKSEFEHVTRTFLPMHSIVRIDEVEKQGASKISKVEGNVTQFPMPIYTPDADLHAGRHEQIIAAHARGRGADRRHAG